MTNHEKRVHELLYSTESRTELCECVAALENENAKLRKQCKELMKQKDCKWCYDRGSECAIVDRLCELGIEVPK